MTKGNEGLFHQYNSLLDHFRELSNAVDDFLDAETMDQQDEAHRFLADLRKSQQEDGVG